MQFLGKIGIPGGGRPGLDPLGANAHFAHVLANRALGNDLAGLAQFGRDLGCAVVLFGSVVDLLNVLLYGVLSLLGSGRLVPEKGPVA